MAEYSSLNIAFIIIINNIIIMLLKNKILRREEKSIYINFSLWIKNGTVKTLIIKNIKCNNNVIIKEIKLEKERIKNMLKIK